MRKKWIVRKADESIVRAISGTLQISNLTATILNNRGISDPKTAHYFLEPEKARFDDPLDMKDIRTAARRIVKAIDRREKICVFGDYDVDGICASAILIRLLRKFGAQVESYIPDREEGYGLNVPALEKIAASGVTLLVTVDCGITNEKEIAAVKDKLDVVVTDHHLPGLQDVTSAVAVVNPNQRDCPYVEKNLCGAGLAFKLCQTLMNFVEGTDLEEYADDIELAALATVADLVPLLGENRKIVYMGLPLMRESKCVGLRALVEASGLGDKKISSGHVAFQIAPRLNSVGRLEHASEGLKLLLTEDADEARELAQKFNGLNQRRKDIEAKILAEAEAIVRRMRAERGGDLSTLVISGRGWEEGVIGLTASKIVERYNLPTIILTTQDGISSRGSCRSIPALHMKNALDTMADLFDKYGGHSQAAGLSIATAKIPELAKRFDDYVRKNLTDEDFQPILYVDMLMNPEKLEYNIAYEFDQFAPYGVGNPHPVIAYANACGTDARAIGKDEKHLSFTFPIEYDDRPNVRAVLWHGGDLAPLVNEEPFDIAYEPSLESWQGETRIQCHVSDLEPAAVVGEFPDRDKLVLVYHFLRRALSRNERFNLCTFVRAFNEATGKNFSTYTFDCAIKVFEELGLLIIDRDKKTFDMPRPKDKLQLTNSRTFRLGRRSPEP